MRHFKEEMKIIWLKATIDEEELTTILTDFINDGIKSCTVKMVSKKREEIVMKVIRILKQWFPTKRFNCQK